MKIKLAVFFALLFFISISFVNAQKTTGKFTITAESVGGNISNSESCAQNCADEEDEGSILSFIKDIFKKILEFFRK